MTSVSLTSVLLGPDHAATGRENASGDAGPLFDAVLALLSRMDASAESPTVAVSEQEASAEPVAEEASREEVSVGGPASPATPIWYPNAPVISQETAQGMSAALLDTATARIPSPAAEASRDAALVLAATDSDPSAESAVAETPDPASTVTAPIRVVTGPSAPGAEPAARGLDTPTAPASRPTSGADTGSAVDAASPADPPSRPAPAPIGAAGTAPPNTPPREGLPIRSDQNPAAPPVSAVSVTGQVVAATTPLVDEPATTPAAARAIAAQVSPVVVNIVQRPAGTHQLTLTVSPDTLGPVTVRAHIGQGGEVRVELVGATDAGRDALRAIVADLRRDLTAAMPTATLSLGSGGGADAGSPDRGTPHGAGDGFHDRPSRDRPAPGAADVSHGGGAADTRARRTLDPTSPALGAGLDILV